MKNYVKTGKAFYGIAIIAYGIQQLLIKDFRSVFIPEFPDWVHQNAVFPYLSGAAFIAIGILITGVIKVNEILLKKICLYFGSYLLLLILFCHLPTRLLISPYSPVHLGLWIDCLKELAIAGGAFVVAGTFSTYQHSSLWLQKLIPFGRIFFSITMIEFGISHFYYTETVAGLVPQWFGIQIFWTYVSGLALIASGVAIILKFKQKQTGMLLAVMLFIWVILLHLPRAINHPTENHGNEIVSMFDALLFCGVALIHAHTPKTITQI